MDARVLGLDVGAVSLSAAEVAEDGTILRTFYEFHHGQVETCLKNVLGTLDWPRVRGISATTSTPGFVKVHGRFDNQICLITTVRRLHPEARSILVIGGERFGLVRFDAGCTVLSD